MADSHNYLTASIRLTGKPLRSVSILRTESEAKLTLDPMRREILRLLAREVLTQANLAKILGLSAPTVSHHLEPLRRAGLISIVKREAEAHGILQNFYRASAKAYVIDTRKLSPAFRRYFMPAKIERTRGILAALSLGRGDGLKPSSKLVEEATEELALHVLEAAQRREGPCGEEDPECVINEIYREALASLLNSKPEIIQRYPTLYKDR